MKHVGGFESQRLGWGTVDHQRVLPRGFLRLQPAPPARVRARFPGRSGLLAVAQSGQPALLIDPRAGIIRKLQRINDSERLVWSRDGKRILVSSEHSVFVTDTQGRPLKRFHA